MTHRVLRGEAGGTKEKMHLGRDLQKKGNANANKKRSRPKGSPEDRGGERNS